MSEKYQPRAGDRVRVVMEGVVGTACEDRFWMGDYIHSNWIHLDAKHVVSVEKATPPLPTTPESVIYNKILTEVRILGADGQWRDSGGDVVWPTLSEDYDVIYDAGEKA